MCEKEFPNNDSLDWSLFKFASSPPPSLPLSHLTAQNNSEDFEVQNDGLSVRIQLACYSVLKLCINSQGVRRGGEGGR